MRRLVAAILVFGLLSGCASVRTRGSTPSPDRDSGGVSVLVFPKDEARRAGRVGPLHVMGELQRHEGGEWTTVFRSLEPSWTVVGLEPGRYRVRFPALLDEAGSVVEISARPEKLRVKRGEVVEVEAILDHVSPAVVAAGVVGVVVAAVLLKDWLDDHDLPRPPRPPKELARVVADTVFWVGVSTPRPAGARRADPPPGVTSHFPANGEVVGIPRPRVIFVLSEAIAPEGDGSGVLVLSEREGLIDGAVSYDTHRWWVVWEPHEDLPAGDTLHVTLRKDAMEDAAGQGMPFPTSFSFHTGSW